MSTPIKKRPIPPARDPANKVTIDQLQFAVNELGGAVGEIMQRAVRVCELVDAGLLVLLPNGQLGRDTTDPEIGVIGIADVTGLTAALNGKVAKAGDTMTGKLVNNASIHIPSGTLVLGAPNPEDLFWNYTYPGNTYVTMDKATPDNDASLVFTQGGRAKWEFGATTEGAGVSPRIHMKVVRNPTANPADDQFLDVMLWDYDSGNVWVNNGYRLGIGTLPQERLHVAGFNVSGARVVSKFENFNTGAGSQSAAHVFQGVGTSWVAGNDFGLNAGHNYFIQDGNSGALAFFANANGVSIGGSTVEATEALRVDSTDGGFLPPRLTTAQRDALGGKNAGLMIFNTTTGQLEYWSSVLGAWQALLGSGTFVTLTTAQTISGAKTFSSEIAVDRDVPALSGIAYGDGHIELVTRDASLPRIGFHRVGTDAAAIYYNGGAEFRIRQNSNADYGFWTSANFNPATKADDAAVVHIAGAETITGAKTFSAVVTASAAIAARQATFDCSADAGHIVSVLQPGSSPAGSSVLVTSPNSQPGIVGNYAGTHRSDIRFQAGSVVIAASASTATPTQGITILSTGVLQISGSSATIAGNNIWHAGNDGAGSGLDADLLDGAQLDANGTANTVAQRTVSGDMYARLFRSTFADQATISGGIAYRVEAGTDNYIRFCNSPAAVKTWLDIDSRDAPLFPTTANAATTLSATHLNGVVEKSNTTAYTYTIAPSLGAQGDAITIVNSGTAGNITLARGTGVALYRNGVDGNLTVAPGTMVTIYRSATANRWIA